MSVTTEGLKNQSRVVHKKMFQDNTALLRLDCYPQWEWPITRLLWLHNAAGDLAAAI